jgi:glycosyltransferase involved in cell wall biosynthesis
MPTGPLVTIGVPVYNGIPHLRAAIESLLKQTYEHVEILISDNASDDGTGAYCRALAEAHPQVHYLRNATNIGPSENFRLVLQRARGRYFMWAAHDDKWNGRFVGLLVEQLARRPEAVLATPAAIHIGEDGTLCSEPPDRPAPGRSSRANLKQLYNDHAASWIYGLWDTTWLKQHFAEYQRLPYWGADVLWLADICLRHAVVGNQDAVIYKRLRPSGYAPQTARETVVFWCAMVWHLTVMSIRRTTTRRERLETLALSWAYVYRLGIRRPYPLRTAWRVVRMLGVAAVTSVPLVIAYASRQLARTLLPTRAL